jgi:hypothetical protein
MPATMTIGIRNYLSILHLKAAAHFVGLSRATEGLAGVIKESEKSDTIELQYAQVMAAVLSAAAFLEATINELFMDAADGGDVGFASQLPVTDREQLTRFWELDIPRTASYPIIRKFEIALAILGREPFDKPGAMWGSARALVDLRNALVHFEPKTWIHEVGEERADEQMEHLEKRLRDKFSESAFATGTAGPFFPAHALGFGCAHWALHSALAFSDRFFAILNIAPNYEPFRGTILKKLNP